MKRFIDALIGMESGGKTDASSVVEDGREFYGLGQMGEARLTDLGLGTDFTMDDYRANRGDLQYNILFPHFSDYNQRIEKAGWDKYEGTEINGVPVTRSGMLAAAHIGGWGGLQALLEKGEDRRDKNDEGTLSYMKRFGGIPLGDASSLKNFSIDSNKKADDQMTFLLAGGGTEALSQSERMNEQDGLGPLPPKSQKRLSFGSGVPQMNPNPSAIDFLPKQVQPKEVTPSPTAGGAGPTFSTSASTQGTPVATGSAPEEEQKSDIWDKIAGTLFKNAENPRQRLADNLAGLSEVFGNLGNITGGAQISAAPTRTIEGIAARKAQVAELEQKRQEAAQKAMMDERRMRLDEAAESRLRAEFNATMGVGASAFTPPEIEQLAMQPSTRHLVSGLNSSDPTTRRAAEKEAYEIIGKAMANANTPEMGAAYEAGVAYSQNPTQENLNNFVRQLNSLDGEDAGRILNAPGVKLPQQQQLARALSQMPEGKEKQDLLRIIRNTGGLEDQMGSQYFKQGFDTFQEYADAADAASRLDVDLARIGDINNNLFRAEGDGATTGAATGSWFATAQRFIAGLPGSTATNVEEFIVQNVTGIETTDLEGLDQASKYLLYEIGRNKVEGQGSVSDSERQSMAQSLISPDTTPEQRAYVLSRLQAANMYEQMRFDMYNDLTSGENSDYRNFPDARRRLAENITGAMEKEISGSLFARNQLQVAGRTKDPELMKLLDDSRSSDPNVKAAAYDALHRRVAPTLSPTQAKYAAAYMKKYGITKYIDKDTGELMPIQ